MINGSSRCANAPICELKWLFSSIEISEWGYWMVQRSAAMIMISFFFIWILWVFLATLWHLWRRKGSRSVSPYFYGKKYRRCVSPTTLRCSLLGATFQLFMLGGGLSAFSNTFSTGPTCHSTCESASCPLHLSFFTLVTLWSQPLPAECLSNQQPDHWWLARRPPPCWSLLSGVCWQKMQIWSFGGWKNTPNYIL